AHGLPERLARQFLTEVATVDVWFHQLMRRHGGALHTGLQWQTDTLVPERELRQTRFFADYLVPCEIGRNLGAIVGDGSSRSLPLTPLCVYRPVRSKPFSAADEEKLSTIRPHFTQAMAVRQRLQAATQNTTAIAIERVSTAVVVLARDRKILLANPAADELFSASGLPLVKDGRLCASGAPECAALDKALAACAIYRFDDHLSLSVRLGGAPGQGVVARLAPVPGSTPMESRAAAIVFIAQEGRRALDIQSIMTMLYKLTPVEAELVKVLADGFTPEVFAERRAVGVATVRTQLRSVFTKTGTRRQSDLMRLVYSIAH
ncbi:MAG TPA: hypothetical protein VLJ57_06015, partial [Burkholderiaceae bacterium]|nr:hypothetical protein [Burkholderiaceae bacterium]